VVSITFPLMEYKVKEMIDTLSSLTLISIISLYQFQTF
jgi:hypothetical protein